MSVFLRHVQESLRQESQVRVTSQLANELLEQVLEEETETVAQEVFDVDVRKRLQLLERCAKATQLLVLGRYWRRWKNRHAGKIERIW